MSSRNLFASILIACLLTVGLGGSASAGQSFLKPGESARNNVIEIKHRGRGPTGGTLLPGPFRRGRTFWGHIRPSHCRDDPKKHNCQGFIRRSDHVAPFRGVRQLLQAPRILQYAAFVRARSLAVLGRIRAGHVMDGK